MSFWWSEWLERYVARWKYSVPVSSYCICWLYHFVPINQYYSSPLIMRGPRGFLKLKWFLAGNHCVLCSCLTNGIYRIFPSVSVSVTCLISSLLVKSCCLFWILIAVVFSRSRIKASWMDKWFRSRAKGCSRVIWEGMEQSLLNIHKDFSRPEALYWRRPKYTFLF